MLKIPQIKMLMLIEDYQYEHKYGPSIRNIRDMAGYSSTAGVFHQLKVLEEGGYITRDRHVARSIRVTKKGGKQIQMLIR